MDSEDEDYEMTQDRCNEDRTGDMARLVGHIDFWNEKERKK
jgi:hypothetical protein